MPTDYAESTVLPVPVSASMTYSRLLGSVVSILVQEPLVRMRCAIGFFAFAGFNVFWTSMAFLLAKPPYSYPEAVIGLFGLIGAAGAYAATITGRGVDRGHEKLVTGGLLVAVLVSWGLLALGHGTWLAAVLAGVIVLDLGVQGLQTTNLAVQFGIRPEARSRIVTAYMTTHFLGGFVGATASGVAYSSGGGRRCAWSGPPFAAVTLML